MSTLIKSKSNLTSMKDFCISLFFFLTLGHGYSQEEFIRIESGKPFALISFLETATNNSVGSKAYRNFIHENLGANKEFNKLMSTYTKLDIDYFAEREGYPHMRYSLLSVRDLIWIASSNAKDIPDFSERIIGYFPHDTHNALIRVLKEVEPYFDKLVWSKESKNIQKIQQQLLPYKPKISELYLKIGAFYGTNWNKEIPFKVALYPIPVGRSSKATVKANVLICGFLSNNFNGTVGRVGVITHEMCHALYNEQPLQLQQQIDKWFASSKSPYAKVAYSFIDEGLATALGNGWAYEQINGELDKNAWYNNPYIDGFAHALYPLVTEYLSAGKNMDQEFVERAIQLFGKTFQDADKDTNMLMSEIVLFSNRGENDQKNLKNTLREHFNIHSMWYYKDILKSVKYFDRKETTKVFVIERNHKKTLELLNSHFPKLKINTPDNSMDIFRDEISKSYLIILNISDASKLKEGLNTLAGLKHLEADTNHRI